ncbi:MAG: hypothetical protein QW450_02065 [Candidatus Nitrosocaldus sp.]
MDLRILVIGAVLIAVGITVGTLFGNIVRSGPLEEFNTARGLAQIGTLIAGIGTLMVLVSFGLKRRRSPYGPGKGRAI